MLYQLKLFLRSVLDHILDPLHFGKSVDRLRVLEEKVYAEEGDLFSVPFNYKGLGHYETISPSQVLSEIRPLYDLVRNLRPRVVCEIGTDKGGTLYLWCQASSSDAMILSLDLPSRRRFSIQRRRLYSLFRSCKRQTLTFIPGDSHVTSTQERVKDLLGNNKIDFLFIDGDHTYDGVKQDYLAYSKYVRSGGIIAFHDIRTVREGCGVRDFWEEVSCSIPLSNRVEFSHQAFGPNGAGIGIILVA